MTDYPTQPLGLDEPQDDIPDRGITQWSAFKHFADINRLLATLTPLAWGVHLDPERPGTFYIAGAPETAVVAEGMTLENAQSIVSLINELPEAIEHFEELSRLWDVLLDGAPTDFKEVTDYLDTIHNYQMRIAQLEGDPAIIPPVSVAGDLTFMHIGQFFSQGEDDDDAPYEPILGVVAKGGKVKVIIGTEPKTIYILNKDEPVKVNINSREYSGLTQATASVDLSTDPDGTS